MEIKRHFIRRPDGTRLRAFDTGGSGDAIVLANGLGGPVSAFNAMIRCLSKTHRVISWDYRGLYGSSLPPAEVDLSIPTHAADVASVLDALGVRHCAFVGWSMGVQVGLELYHQDPSRLTHLVLMNGTFGRPFRGVPLPASEKLIERLVRGAGRAHFLGKPLVGQFRRSGAGLRLLKGLGFISQDFDDGLFAEMLEDFETIDFALYLRILAELGRHDAESVLPKITVPTLVITGSRDRLTPSYGAARIVRQVPHAEFFMVPGATHYAAAEFPDAILARLVPFLASSGTTTTTTTTTRLSGARGQPNPTDPL